MVATLLLLALGAPAGAAELAWVHVEANVGGASGGHSALRLGDDVYHFQAWDDRLILARHPWGTFHFVYNVLQNRPLHLAHLPLDAADLRRVRDAFTALYLEQQQLLDELSATRRDVAVLEALAGERAGAPLRGAGLLRRMPPGSAEGLALRAHIEARLGSDFLSAAVSRSAASRDRALGRLESPRGLRETLTRHAALVALQRGDGLDPDAVVAAGGPALTAAERRTLAATATAFAETAVELLRSARPDRGAALFAAVARHHAAWRSAADGQLIFADPFPDGAPVLRGRDAAERRDELAAVADEMRARLASARGILAKGAPLEERRYQELEALAARAREYARGAGGAPVRETSEALLPQRSREQPLPATRPLPAVRGALARGRLALRQQERALDARHPYHLLRSNCVTELARVLEASLGGAQRAQVVLGVRLDTGSPLDFVPRTFFERLAGEARRVRVERLPSYRERALARLAAAGRLRERSALTSRIYRRRAADGSFVLFSDGATAPRPLIGATNLAWSVADGALGLVTAPFDRGRRLKRAGYGALFSAPELAFVSIRKGSFDAASLRGAPQELLQAP